MDRRPGWLRAVAAVAYAIGVVAFVAGPGPFVWHPAAGDRWLWPVAAVVTMDDLVGASADGAGLREAEVVVLDPFTTSEHIVWRVHATRRAAVCRLRAGVWESGRPDESRVDPSLLGANAGPDGRWLDIRDWSRVAELIGDRLALCAAKGFDGAALANLDGYARPTGFPITATDQLRFNTALVHAARSYGLLVAVVANRRTPVPVEADVVVTEPRCVKPLAAGPPGDDRPQETVRSTALGGVVGTWGMSTRTGS